MIYDVRKLPHSIEIGFTGEHKFRKIQIDMSAWTELIPAGVPYIVYIQPGKSAEDAYKVTTTFDNNILTWEITETDLGNEKGTGVAQVWLEDATEETMTLNQRGMSAAFYVKVDKCVGTDEPGIPPETFNWGALFDSKLDKTAIANNLVTTSEGKALDARQGKILNDGKLDKTDVVNNLETTDAGKALDARQGKALDESKINRSSIANNLTTTEEGSVLDARQGKALNDGKIDRPAGVEEGKFLQTDSSGNAVWGSPASEEVIRDAAEGWLADHVSQGVTLAVDDTLTLSGYAADARVAGNRISEVKGAFESVSTKTKENTNAWTVGSLAAATGNDIASTTRLRMDNYVSTENNIFGFKAKPGYEFLVYAWDKTTGTYAGCMKSGMVINTSAANYLWLTEFYTSFNTNYKYRVILAKTDHSATMTTADAPNLLYMVRQIDDTLSELNIAADARKVGYNVKGLKNSIENDVEQITGNRALVFLPGYYTTPSSGAVSLEKANDYVCAISPCSKGDVFTAHVIGGSGTQRAWVKLNSNMEALDRSGQNAEIDGTVSIVGDNTKYICFNCKIASLASGYYAFRGTSVNKRILDMDKSIEEVDFSLKGGEIEYGKAYIETLTNVYDGKQIRIDIGKTLANAAKADNSYMTNYIIPIPEGAEKITYKAYKTTGKYGCVFLDKNNIILDGYANKDTAGKIITVTIPKNSTYFVYTISSYYDDYSAIFKSQGQLSEEQYPIGLHTKPQSIGALNAIKNARQLTDIKWTAQENIPRVSSVTLDSYAESGSVLYEDRFDAGKDYSGIPYCDVKTKKRLIGTDVAIDTYISAMFNRNTVEYEESQYHVDSGNDIISASYYGCACTGLVSYALNTPYIYSTYYNHFYGMTSKFKLVDDGVRHTLSDLMLCDVFHVDGHCVFVTDIITGKNNEVEFVEISEETTRGNTIKDLKGTKYGGKSRRLMYTTEEIYTIFRNYTVYRYDYLDSVEYVQNAYSPMADEGQRIENPYFPVLPYMGDKCIIPDSRDCVLLINASGYTHVSVKKNGVAWNENGTTDAYEIGDNSQITIHCDDEEAVYTARLMLVVNGVMKQQTRTCSWYIMRGTQITASASGGTVTFTVKTDRNEFIPWFANIRQTRTLYGYNNMIFDDYDYEYTESKHQYTFEVSYSGNAPTTYLIGLKSPVYGAVELTGDIS